MQTNMQTELHQTWQETQFQQLTSNNNDNNDNNYNSPFNGTSSTMTRLSL